MKRFAFAIATAALLTATSLPASADFQGGRNTGFSPVRNYHHVDQAVYGLTGETPQRARASAYSYTNRIKGGR